jgi:hypothetical protein
MLKAVEILLAVDRRRAVPAQNEEMAGISRLLFGGWKVSDEKRVYTGSFAL